VNGQSIAELVQCSIGAVRPRIQKKRTVNKARRAKKERKKTQNIIKPQSCDPAGVRIYDEYSCLLAPFGGNHELNVLRFWSTDLRIVCLQSISNHGWAYRRSAGKRKPPPTTAVCLVGRPGPGSGPGPACYLAYATATSPSCYLARIGRAGEPLRFLGVTVWASVVVDWGLGGRAVRRGTRRSTTFLRWVRAAAGDGEAEL
jgi:hypothetical protein